MQRLEVSGAVRPIYGSLGVKRLMIFRFVTPYTITGRYSKFLQWYPLIRIHSVTTQKTVFRRLLKKLNQTPCTVWNTVF